MHLNDLEIGADPALSIEEPGELPERHSVPDGERMVIVASKGGYTKNPGWYHNLKAHPDTHVELPKEGRVAVRAHVASGEERRDLWPRVVDLYAGYAEYQDSTSREIPVVVLERR